MQSRRSMRVSRCGIAFILLAGWASVGYAQWTPLANPFPGHPDTCVLLTDGTVMCHEYNTNRWHRLTPDLSGSYQYGTWSPLAPMPDGTDTSGRCAPSCTYAPLYFASVVLPDGKVVIIGGEYNSLSPVWTNIGFIYDPATDSWSPQLAEAFGTGRIGDASAIVLADGRMALSDIATGNIETLDPAALLFTPLNPTGKLDRNNEEGWTILPNNTVLTVDSRIVSSFEIYDPITNTWGSSGTTVVNLADTGGPPVGDSSEVGPGVLRPDGTLIYFSGNSTGQNAVYDTVAGVWTNTPSMDFPLVPGQTFHYGVADGPASLLPNGNVLVMASPVINGRPFNSPSHFFEFDGATLNQVADSPNAAAFTSYQGRMVLLPSGEVLLTAYNQVATQDVVLYSNGGSPMDVWRPIITSAPSVVGAGSTYPISGTQFSGFSEGASYGDDAQSSTNYPLVRITNRSTGHVFYTRTHDHSRMGVVPIGSGEIITTYFTTPATLEPGDSDLEVVTNGIPSLPVLITIERQVAIAIRPHGEANRIRSQSGNLVRVAILSADEFDATTVLAETVRFGATGREAAPATVALRDVDDDGDIDMVLRFVIQDTGIQCGQTSAVLTGLTADGLSVRGADFINVVGCQN
jgi:hypothetical protein